jgi:ferredoxin-NADP reductase
MLENKTGIIDSVIQETPNTRRYFIAVDKQSSIFEPGQFITLDLPIHEKKNKRLRSYSIANAPNKNGIIELVIVRMQEGLGTTYLFENADIGTEITFRGPLGHFVIPQPLPKDLFLICTGTGIAPFRAMIHKLIDDQISTANVTLIVGTRTEEDLLYHTELQQLSQENDWFQYVPTLSRSDWNGAKGYVHDIYKKMSTGKSEAHFMLCGWRNMIDQARLELQELGFPKDQIHFELYG